jgi:type IV secretory pathway VirJ component
MKLNARFIMRSDVARCVSTGIKKGRIATEGAIRESPLPFKGEICRKFVITAFLLLSILAVSSISALTKESTISWGRFGALPVYYQNDHPPDVVLFISGENGWNKDMAGLARDIATWDALVVGVDMKGFAARLANTKERCAYPAADFELLSKFVQKKFGFSDYRVPMIMGYESGAALAYALLSQAPQGTFRSALCMEFCPALPLKKPLCKGSGRGFLPASAGSGFRCLPDSSLTVPWIAFQGTAGQACSMELVKEFVKKCGAAQMVKVQGVNSGFPDKEKWLPQLKSAFIALRLSPPYAVHATSIPDDTVSSLPLVEVPAVGKARDVLGIFLSGDGGWAEIDKTIADSLANKGICVVGWNSLRYFWKERSPQEASEDLEKILNHYQNIWKKDTVICIGFSFGADAFPAMISRLPRETFGRIRLIALLGLSNTAEFHFHIANWLGEGASNTSFPVLPDLEKIKGKRIIYFFGKEDKESIAGEVKDGLGTVIYLPGGHHFGGRYDIIADSIVSGLSGGR